MRNDFLKKGKKTYCDGNIQRDFRQALQTAIELTEQKVLSFRNTFPSPSGENNFFQHTENTDWTPGFWTGQLWLAYQATNNTLFKTIASEQVESFLYRIKNRINTDHHDMGFLYSPSCVVAYELTKNIKAKEAALMAADNLMNRFQETGQFFQAWGKMNDPDNYRLIIDCLMNMPLLFWASETTGINSYKNKAIQHIKTAMKNLVRDDFSTYHTFYFDMKTGLPIKGVTCQGNRNDSAWARGQAWGIYGSAIAYSKLKYDDYVNIFKGITDFFLAHLPADFIPYWDFDFCDGSSEPRDTSAAAIAICGIHEMLPYLNDEDRSQYREKAVKMLKALVNKCAVRSAKLSNGLLLHGTYAKRSKFNSCSDYGVDEVTAWGDYFYLEALMRFNEMDIVKW